MCQIILSFRIILHILQFHFILNEIKGMMVLPVKKLTMLRARATVMQRGKIDTVRERSSPTRRPTRAVEYNEKIVPTMIEVKISAECLFISWGVIENQGL